MTAEEQTKVVELMDGYTDGQGRTHTRVVFGRRITGRDFFRLDADPQAQNPLQYEDLILWEAITEFGQLPITNKQGERLPAILTALLSLTSDDHALLVKAHNEFQRLTGEDREIEFIGDDKVKLAFGFEQGGVSYNLVEFGTRLTRLHEVESSKAKLSGVAQMCYLLGRQITKISVAGGAAEIAGPIPLQMFETLDGADITTLQTAGENWRDSFRRGRATVPGERPGEKRAVAGEVHEGVERGEDTRAAGRET